MNLQSTVRKRLASRGPGNRRYTLRDMAMIKLNESQINGRAKREGQPRPNMIRVCGCGVEGCFIIFHRGVA